MRILSQTDGEMKVLVITEADRFPMRSLITGRRLVTLCSAEGYCVAYCDTMVPQVDELVFIRRRVKMDPWEADWEVVEDE